ncbi:MAG: glycolate oxidase iron-sulfur subunit [Methyloprofundus sp.]|nr:MAG: glycolate oxidase iron-sulfur subunit [Methyloprofundus sp.]
MQTKTSTAYLNTTAGQTADAILRACVHCGFCTATCPTYQLTANELDSPRGRIYLIKQLLEEQVVSNKTQQHLDRCLSCLACETTCPSGVQYGHLLDIGRELVDQQVQRPLWIRSQRYALRKLLPYPKRMAPLLSIGQLLRPYLPKSLQKHIPASTETITSPIQTHVRKMLVLQGCIQSIATPNTNHAARHLLNKLNIELISVNTAGCCGAVSQHLSAPQETLQFMRANIDAWWPYIEQGVEAIVITASGCGAMLQDYAYLLQHDPDYAVKAQRVSILAKDISEILTAENFSLQRTESAPKHIAFQSPCSLQHAQQLNGVVETLLTRCGFELSHVTDAHLCCGSAGTYSILQADLSQQLLTNKLIALQQYTPEMIVTANIGCQLHLQTQSKVPVKHWIELLNASVS